MNWKALVKKTATFIVDLYHVILLPKSQLIVAAIAVLLFIIPGQILEIYRVLWEDFENRWSQAALAIIGAGFLTFMLLYSARWMTLNVTLNELNSQSRSSTLLRSLPRLFSITPGVALGLLLAFAQDA